MQAYRNEEAGLRARLEELEQQEARRQRQRGRLRGELASRGWVPRSVAVRQRWILAAMVSLLLSLMVLAHVLFFQPQQKKPVKARRPAKLSASEMVAQIRPLHKRHGELMATLARLQRVHFEFHHNQWQNLGTEFLTLDGNSKVDAQVLVLGLACVRSRWDFRDQIERGLSPDQRQKLLKFCKAEALP